MDAPRCPAPMSVGTPTSEIVFLIMLDSPACAMPTARPATCRRERKCQSTRESPCAVGYRRSEKDVRDSNHRESFSAYCKQPKLTVKTSAFFKPYLRECSSGRDSRTANPALIHRMGSTVVSPCFRPCRKHDNDSSTATRNHASTRWLPPGRRAFYNQQEKVLPRRERHPWGISAIRVCCVRIHPHVAIAPLRTTTRARRFARWTLAVGPHRFSPPASLQTMTLHAKRRNALTTFACDSLPTTPCGRWIDPSKLSCAMHMTF